MRTDYSILFGRWAALKLAIWRLFVLCCPPVARLEAELERERLRLAACGVAALGYFEGCKPEYDSGSLQDVLRLYRDHEQLSKV
jgi:hypothetical protein